jgi:hypothetical protein
MASATISATLPTSAPAVRKAAPYLFLGQTTSLCETCLGLVPAKIIAEDGRVYFQKRCRAHGVQKTLVADDLAYWKSQRDWVKPGDRPLAPQSRTEHGCPYDCGLCPDHEQHSCLAIIEINDACNLTCPVCFASSAVGRGGHRPLGEIEAMLDAVVASEGEPDLVQLSGGEPTLHPEFFAVLRAAKARPIRHLMINTNGLRIAREPGFAERLAEFMPGLEVYLQVDSLRREALIDLRGADLSRVRVEALEALERAGVSTTLVATVKKGVNDADIPDLVRFALGWRCVRGVTFQPVQDAGRNEGFEPGAHRMVLTEIRRKVAEAEVFGLDDLIPLPCNPDQICIGYGLRNGREVTPLTSLLPREAQYRGVRGLSGAAAARLRPALAVDRPGRHVGQALQPALLPARRSRAGGALLRTHLPGGDLAVPRPVQFRPRHGEALLRALRAAGRADHPVRHLQHLLPTGRGGERGAGRRAGGAMSSPESPSPPAQFFGWLLVCLGALMVLLCGGCTLVIWGISLYALIQTPNAGGFGQMGLLVLMSSMIGGLPAAGGGVLVWAGWRALHPLRQPGKQVESTFD